MSVPDVAPAPSWGHRARGSLGPGLSWAVLGGLLGGVFLLGIAVGAVPVPPASLVGSVLAALGVDTAHRLEPVQEAVLLSIRLPRALLGMLVGAVLALSGAALQALFRNPLVDPGLLGTTGGASVGAVTAILLDAVLASHLGPLRALSVPAAAFLGALIATVLAYRLGLRGGRTEGPRVLLAGVAISAGASACVGLLISVATDAQLRSITFWNLGSLGGASWEAVRVAVIPLGAALVLLLSEGSRLNLLMLGEREARHLGVDVERLQRRLILAAALGVGAAVAFTGTIGFVGLVVPSLLRLVLGPDNRRLLGASALMGAALLVGADVVARTVVAPLELPIGALTSALGAPAFIVLLARGGGRA
ncbi:iron ABC transporter permease [Myxococcaceae bacterium JPH2]|nr:iron ABC transporter permease [Myxococcaceae bacterium JPH2]